MTKRKLTTYDNDGGYVNLFHPYFPCQACVLLESIASSFSSNEDRGSSTISLTSSEQSLIPPLITFRSHFPFRSTFRLRVSFSAVPASSFKWTAMPNSLNQKGPTLPRGILCFSLGWLACAVCRKSVFIRRLTSSASATPSSDVLCEFLQEVRISSPCKYTHKCPGLMFFFLEELHPCQSHQADAFVLSLQSCFASCSTSDTRTQSRLPWLCLAEIWGISPPFFATSVEILSLMQ